MSRPLVSVVLPVFNEEPSLAILHERLSSAAAAMADRDFEFVFVDDGSTDGSAVRVRGLSRTDPRVRLVELDGHQGECRPLQAGLDAARGDLLVSMDADLEHRPEDIARLLAKLEDGHDLVCGWREGRDDGFLRKFPSRVANALARRISGACVRDFGSAFRAYRRGKGTDFRLSGGLHRFVPALVHLKGGRIAEIPIRLDRRRFGKSHYGLARTWAVVRDLAVLGVLAWRTRNGEKIRKVRA